MNKEEFIKEVTNLNIPIDEAKLSMLNTYYLFLNEYNLHTNLTAITEEKEVYLKHFYDSLTLTKVVDLNKVETLIDIGTGAGFPAVVLKIFFPHLKITLLDSNNKKTTFLKELIAKLDLKDVSIVNERAEDFIKAHQGLYDICTSRAVAYIDIIASLALPFIKQNGKVILMKGSFIEEKEVLISHQKDLGIKSYEIKKFNLPIINSERTLVTLERDNNIKILNYSQIIKRNKLWTKNKE